LMNIEEKSGDSLWISIYDLSDLQYQKNEGFYTISPFWVAESERRIRKVEKAAGELGLECVQFENGNKRSVSHWSYKEADAHYEFYTLNAGQTEPGRYGMQKGSRLHGILEEKTVRTHSNRRWTKENKYRWFPGSDEKQ